MRERECVSVLEKDRERAGEKAERIESTKNVFAPEKWRLKQA